MTDAGHDGLTLSPHPTKGTTMALHATRKSHRATPTLDRIGKRDAVARQNKRDARLYSRSALVADYRKV